MVAMIDSQKSQENSRPHMDLRCRVDTSLLSLLRDFVSSVARHLRFSEQEIAEIEISVDEACANAMEHAYSQEDGKPADVHVELYLCADHMRIRISDTGNGIRHMDPDMNMDAYLDINREKFRGLGLVLMQKFMDDVQIHAVPGEGTIVEMTKRKQPVAG